MYDVTITNCETLVITRKQVKNPLDALDGIDYLEAHIQHEVKEQYDINLTAANGDIIHVKVRKHDD